MNYGFAIVPHFGNRKGHGPDRRDNKQRSAYDSDAKAATEGIDTVALLCITLGVYVRIAGKTTGKGYVALRKRLLENAIKTLVYTRIRAIGGANFLHVTK